MSAKHDALAALVGRALTDAEVAQIDGHLMSIARTADTLTTQQVSDALNKAGG